MDNKTARKVGIMGGTFNPVHTGHLLIAQAAYESLALDEILFVPCAIPAHKKGDGIVDAKDRVAMLKLAVKDDARFAVSDIETRRAGISYAVDTLRELQSSLPNTGFTFIIGMDSLLDLHLWRDIYALLALCSFAIFARPGYTDCPSELELGLDAPWPARLLARVFTSTQFGVSASDIRHRRAEGMSIRYMVPLSVERYIKQHALYEKTGSLIRG